MIQLLRKCLYIFQLKVIPQSVKNLVLCGYWNHINSSKVKPQQFQVGDLVMRKAHPYELENKLSPKWTGPFRVTEAKGNGSYNLETLEGGVKGTLFFPLGGFLMRSPK